MLSVAERLSQKKDLKGKIAKLENHVKNIVNIDLH